jgi:sugar (pentulose or hexulose) kinase
VEQDPEAWWASSRRWLRAVSGEVKGIRALLVTSTSGRFAVLGAQGRPLRPAILYSDGRATQEPAEPGVRPTDPVAKLLWLRRHEPEVYGKVRRIVHAADFVTARLTGRWAATDWSHAPKTGYDVVTLRWSPILEKAAVEVEILPEVLPPATPIGSLTRTGRRPDGAPTRDARGGRDDGRARGPDRLRSCVARPLVQRTRYDPALKVS